MTWLRQKRGSPFAERERNVGVVAEDTVGTFHVGTLAWQDNVDWRHT